MKWLKPLLWPWLGMLIFTADSFAQGAPTSKRTTQLSVFALLGDTYTGLSAPVTDLGGRNLTGTLGMNLGLYNRGQLGASVEVRGAYPISEGHVDGQKSVLAGLRGEYRFVDPRLAHLRLYADVLAGRGSIHYADAGYRGDRFLYLRSVSNVYSGGVGLEVSLTNRWSVLGDVQFQHWNTPVIASGSLLAVQGSGGVGFAFRFGGDKAH